MEVYIPSKTSAHIFLTLADFHIIILTEMVVKPEKNEATADKKQQRVNK